MTEAVAGQRNSGLDLVRAAAISMVALYHAPLGVPGKGVFELCGVDVFFSLSGFLITQMAFERFGLLGSTQSLIQFLTSRMRPLAARPAAAGAGPRPHEPVAARAGQEV